MGRKAEFKTNNEMELLARLAEKQPDVITPTQRMALGLYLENKKAASGANNRQTEGGGNGETG